MVSTASIEDDKLPPGFVLNETVGKPIAIGMFYGQIWSSLQEVLNFTYTMVESVDGSWGSQRNGEWNGMIGMILRGDVEIGVSTFTVTKERSKVVDFSTILG